LTKCIFKLIHRDLTRIVHIIGVEAAINVLPVIRKLIFDVLLHFLVDLALPHSGGCNLIGLDSVGVFSSCFSDSFGSNLILNLHHSLGFGLL